MDPVYEGGALVLAHFAEDQPLYLRTCAIACKSHTDICLVSVGNLVRNEAKIGIICCAFSQLTKATKEGFVCNSYDLSRRVLTIHNTAHAYESCGATWVLSVPVWAPWHDDLRPSDHFSPDDVIGFLTLAWAQKPSETCQYIRTAQKVAEQMAGDLVRTMQPVVDVALEVFLPQVQPAVAEEKQPSDSCRTSSEDLTRPREAPGGSGVPAGVPTGWSTSAGSGPPQSPRDDKEGLIEKESPIEKGSAALPGLGEIGPDKMQVGKATASETPRSPSDFVKPRSPQQRPLLQRLWPASLFGYMAHREVVCCCLSIAVAFASVGLCTSGAVTGGLNAPTLLLCFVVEVLLHTCFCLCQKASHVGSEGAGTLQLPFRTTSLLRARIIMPLCCYTMYFGVRKCLGLSSIAACAVTALPLLAGNCGLLYFMSKWEAGSRGSVPAAQSGGVRVSI